MTEFKDIGKKASDFLKKDFPLSQKLEVKCNSNSTDEVKFTLDSNKGNSTGTIEPKINLSKEYNVTASGKLSTSSNYSIKVESKDKLVDGLKNTVEFKSGSKQSVVAGFLFKNKTTAVGANVSVPTDAETAAIDFAATASQKDFVFGFQGDASFANGAVNLGSINAGIQYQAPNYVFATLFKNRGDKLDVEASYFQKVNSTSISAKVNVPTTGTANPVLSVGYGKTIDDLSSFKFKANTNGVVGVSYKHDLSNFTTATFGYQVNSSDLSSAVGCQLNIQV